MPWGRGGMGIRKHRQAVKRTTPVSGPTKLAMQRAANASRRLVRAIMYGSMRELMRSRRAVERAPGGGG